jgi:hypothetical protein
MKDLFKEGQNMIEVKHFILFVQNIKKTPVDKITPQILELINEFCSSLAI